jgi:hypothetical protein
MARKKTAKKKVRKKVTVMKTNAEMAEPRIVAGTGVATRTPVRGVVVEEAMSAAILQANAEGISDPEIIKERMAAAREEAKAAWREAEDRAQAEMRAAQG